MLSLKVLFVHTIDGVFFVFNDHLHYNYSISVVLMTIREYM